MWHGCAHIAGLYPVRSTQQDYLTYGANLIAGLGFDTIKLEMSVAYSSLKYANQAFGTPTTLTQLAQEAAFAATFADVRFTRYVLSAFSLTQGGNNPWAGEFNDANGDSQEAEFYDLAVHLSTTYPSKIFILKNWEGDWQLLNSFNPASSQKREWLAAYVDYNRRRQRAVRRAMRNSTSGGRVYYALECNRVLDDHGFRVHRDVIPAIRPDMVSLSAYEAIEGWTETGGSLTEQAAIEIDIASKLERMQKRLWMAGMPRTTPVFIGEFGFPQQAPYFPGTLDAVGMLDAVINSADSLGYSGEIYWQGLSNEEYAAGQPRGFNLWARNGNSDTVGALNALGAYYSNLLAE